MEKESLNKTEDQQEKESGEFKLLKEFKSPREQLYHWTPKSDAQKLLIITLKNTHLKASSNYVRDITRLRKTSSLTWDSYQESRKVKLESSWWEKSLCLLFTRNQLTNKTPFLLHSSLEPNILMKHQKNGQNLFNSSQVAFNIWQTILEMLKQSLIGLAISFLIQMKMEKINIGLVKSMFHALDSQTNLTLVSNKKWLENSLEKS